MSTNSEKRRGKLSASFYGKDQALSSQSQVYSSEDSTAALADIDIVPGFNPRTYLSEDSISEEFLSSLTESIRENGVLQSIAVRKEGGRWKLIAGERRYHAARYAGLSHVPILILDVDAKQARRLAIIENAQRKEVDIVSETLLGFELLASHTGLSQDEVVAHLNAVRKKRQEDVHGIESLLRSTYGTGISLWSQRRATVLKMNEAERAALRNRKIEVAGAAELVNLPEGKVRQTLLERAITEQLSAPQLRKLVEEARATPQEEQPMRVQLQQLKKNLSRVPQLQGEQGTRARQLVEELTQLLS